VSGVPAVAGGQVVVGVKMLTNGPGAARCVVAMFGAMLVLGGRR